MVVVEARLKHYEHSPTLRTIQMVENFLREHDGDLFSKNELERKLPRRVQRHTLNRILSYLGSSNKVIVGPKGVMWVWNENSKIKELIAKGTRVA
jgi:hypothetical protein